jgi:hypothetical protein
LADAIDLSVRDEPQVGLCGAGWFYSLARRHADSPPMPRENLCCTGLLPRRTLAVLCVAATAAAGVALGGCESTDGGRPKSPKSTMEKKSSSKSAPKWESSSSESIEESSEFRSADTGYDGQRVEVVTTKLVRQESIEGTAPQGGAKPQRVEPASAQMAPMSPMPATPPVMLGVRMRAIDPVLATHLGVDPRAASVLEDVAEELNGHAGGLRDHDVIVAVDGKTPADPGSVRRVLRSKKAGDTIDFTVVRPGGKIPGGKIDLKVTLEAFDHGKFMSATPARVGG